MIITKQVVAFATLLGIFSPNAFAQEKTTAQIDTHVDQLNIDEQSSCHPLKTPSVLSQFGGNWDFSMTKQDSSYSCNPKKYHIETFENE